MAVGRPCGICNDPKRTIIDRDILNDITWRELERRYKPHGRNVFANHKKAGHINNDVIVGTTIAAIEAADSGTRDNFISAVIDVEQAMNELCAIAITSTRDAYRIANAVPEDDMSKIPLLKGVNDMANKTMNTLKTSDMILVAQRTVGNLDDFHEQLREIAEARKVEDGST